MRKISKFLLKTGDISSRAAEISIAAPTPPAEALIALRHRLAVNDSSRRDEMSKVGCKRKVQKQQKRFGNRLLADGTTRRLLHRSFFMIAHGRYF